MNLIDTPIINIGHSEIFLRSDDIIQVNATDHTYSVEDIKDIHEVVHNISVHKKSFLLVVASNYTSIDSDARQFLATPEAGLFYTAKAYVIKSLAQRLLLNFLMMVQGTPVPAKFFIEIDEAVKWLNIIKQDQLVVHPDL